MPEKRKSLLEICPRCGSGKTVRVDPERNLMKCTECDLWFGE